jgi:Mg2+ and Co2+ transporter CorA
MLLYLSILQTILLLLIAVGTGYLIYRSSRSTQGTRKSLHSRRSEVYKDVVRILTLLGQKGDLRKEELLDFRSRTQDVALLFDEEIAAYIEEIYTRGVKLMSTNEILKRTTLPVGDERDQITVENAKQLIWLADQLVLVKKKFQHYPDVE